MGKSVLITGGAGFIGSHMVESLLADGHRVIALDDLTTGSLRNIQMLIGKPNFRFQLGSVLDAQLCNEVVAECDEVMHLAAAVGVKMIFERPMETIERNVRGTENILEAALRFGRKVFLASTSEVYGKEAKSGTDRFREDNDIILGPSMRWCYACSKALDEYLGRAYSISKGLPLVIGRFFNTVGPRQSGAYGMVIPRFVEWALAGRPIQVYGDGNQVRTFTHVKDAVRAACTLMTESRAEGQIINIGSEEPITIYELARRVKDMTNSHSEIVRVPYEQAYGQGFEDIRNRVPDLTKIYDLIGYRSECSLDRILQDTISYFRQQS
ncbi:MAG TPA: GDP-mannose 4,6-dehydratase [Blastocatellia bacterium]|nr:GDP-mannose 4,6-dehydratase [Blastocatellia bacterium]